MSAAQILTANEIAPLSGLDEGRVRKEVEYGIFTRPNFTFANLVYFAVLGVQLGVDDRRKLHDLVAGAMGPGRRPSRVEFSPVFELRLDRVAKDEGASRRSRTRREGDLPREQQLQVVRRAVTGMNARADISLDGKLVFEEIPSG